MSRKEKEILPPEGGHPRMAATPRIDLSNLSNCTEDARLAALDSGRGPADPVDFDSLRARIALAVEKLPPLYRVEVGAPFVLQLNSLGRQGFQDVLLQDPSRTRIAGLMLDIAHGILQNGENFEGRATDAFEEVVSDLYDGFLSAQDRGGSGAQFAKTSPLVKWGNPDFGPYTWPVTATRAFDIKAAIVSLPPANAHRGVLAWSALAHETGGHDILAADDNLEEQVTVRVRAALAQSPFLAEYWGTRVSETAADVLGILNLGPAAAIGMIGYFRGLNAAFGSDARLRNSGPANDEHPADILRAFLGAATVRMLSFAGHDEWADAIEAEAGKDLSVIRLGGQRVRTDDAIASARIAATAIATATLPALKDRSFISIQNWRDRDEAVAQQLCRSLTTTVAAPTELAEGIFAAHAVAAATYCALKRGANLPMLFDRMLGLLKVMHDANPSWGPLFVRHPGNIQRHYNRLAVVESRLLTPSLCQEIVFDSTPNPPDEDQRDPNDTLGQFGVTNDDDTIGMFRSSVSEGLHNFGFSISRESIPAGANVTVAHCRDGVFANAQ